MGSATGTPYEDVMSKITDSRMIVDALIAQVVANARLEGHALEEQTIDVVRRIASGEMTKDDAVAWRKARAEDAAWRFEKATANLAAEGRFGGPDQSSTEIKMMDEALSLTDAVRKALPSIREMGRKEIAKTHAAGEPAHVSDGRGGIVRIDPDGSRSRVP